MPLPRRSLLARGLAAAALLTGCVAPPPAVVRTAPAPARSARAPAAVAAEITSDCGITKLRENVLKQLNAVRAEARSCGPHKMKSARPVVWDRALAEAAEQHSVDMIVRRYFDHVSPDGKRVGQRAAAQGYKWRMVGENLAGGDASVSGVIAGWLGSPEHCQNMMSPAYADVGVSCVRQSGSQWTNYWTMVLGTKR